MLRVNLNVNVYKVWEYVRELEGCIRINKY